MKKRFVFGLMCVCLMMFNVGDVNALESNVSSSDELIECIEGNGKCIISSDFEAADVVIDQKNVTIDLNGKTLTSNIKLENKANLVIIDSKGNGSITNTKKTIIVLSGSKLVLESGLINSGNQGVTLEGGNYVMNGGKVTASEMGVVYLKKSNVEINKGVIETKDNAAIGDNGSAGNGGNVVTINGGQLISNIVSNGYISCGIYNSNDTTLTVKAGTKIVANNGGAGIVVRGGKVTVDNQVIQDMVTGTTKGKVGDSRVIVSGKIVKDYYSSYPAKDTIDVSINYSAIEMENGSVGNKLTVDTTKVLNEEIKKIINENKISELSNVDLADLSIEANVSDVSGDDREAAIDKIKSYIKDFGVGKVINIDILIKNDGSLVKSLIETSNKIPFQISVDDIIKNDKLNYEFQVIRIHIDENGTEMIDVLETNYDADAKVVSFESDQFSTFLVNYKTSEKAISNPKTFDGIGMYMIVLLLSLVGIAFVGSFLRRQRVAGK